MRDLIKLLFVSMLFLFFSAEATPWLPMKIANGQVTIPVKIQGLDAVAMIDTGAADYYISKDFVEKHKGLLNVDGKTKLNGVHSREKVDLVRGLDLEIFGTKLMINYVPTTASGSYVDMIIGAEYLKRFIVQFDYPKEKIRFLPRDAINMDDYANVTLLRERYGSSLNVRVQVNQEKNVWLTFDTGNCSDLFLSRYVVNDNDWNKDKPIESKKMADINGKVGYLEQFNLGSIQIGPYELENISAVIPVKSQSTYLDRIPGKKRLQRSNGLLGYNVLRHFIVTLDYASKKLNISRPEDAVLL